MSNLKKAISIVLAVLMVASVSPLSMAYVTFPNGDPYVAGTDYVYSDASAVTNPTPITVDTYGTTETIRIANKDRPILDYKEESGVRTSYVVRANDAGIAETSGTFANFAYGYLSGVAQSLPFNPVIKLRINGISSTDPISGLAVSCDGLTGSVGTPTSTTGSNYVEFTWTVPTSMYTTFNSSGTGEGMVIWTINFIYAKRAYVAHAYSAKKYVVRPNGMLRVGKWEPTWHNNKCFAHITQLLCAQSIPGFASTSGGDHSYFDYTVNNLSGNALSGGGFDDIGNGSVIIDDWTNGGTAWFRSDYKKDDWDTWKTINPADAEAKYRPKSLNGDAPRTKIYIDTPYDHLGVGTANGKTNGLNLRLVWKTTDKGNNNPQKATFMEAIKVRADGNLGSNLGGSTASCGSAAAGTMSVNLSHVYHDGSGFNNLSSMNTQGRKSDGTGGYVNADGDTTGPNYVLHSFSGTGALTNNTTWSIDYLIKSTLNSTASDSDYLKSTNTLQVTFITYNTTTLRSVLTAIDNGTGFTYNNTSYPGKGKLPQNWMYTEGWSTFETAYDAARSVIAKFNVTQSDINTALTNLVSAYNGLTGYTPTGTITVRHCLVNTTTELVPAQTFTRATTWGNQNNSSYDAISNGASFSISGLVNSSNQCTLRGYKFVGPSNIRGSATFTPTGTVLTDEYDTNLGSEIIFYYEPATVKLKVATGIYDVGHEDATGQQFVYNADVRTGDDLNDAATVNDLAEIKAYIENHYTHPAYTVYGGMYDNSSYSGQNIDGINLAGGLTSWKMPPQDTNAYIKWNAKPVKLRINTTYGTVYTDLAAVQTPAILDDHTYEMGTVTFDLTSFNHPTSDGYDFVNYYKEASYTNVAGNTITASYDNSEEYRIVVDGTSDYNYVDIYAKYVNLSSKIVFDPQGGTIADNTAVGSYTVVNNELSYSGATLPVSIGYPIPVRPGYVFKGWALQDGTPISGWTTYDATTGYAPVANGTHSMTSTTGLVAYAQWTPGQIMMTFQLGFDPNTESYTMNSKNLENEDFYFRTQVLADQNVDRTQFPSDPRRYGYVFNYWSYEGRRFNQAKYPTSDFTLLASWKAATDTAFGELISYVNIGGEDQIADIQHKNSNKLNPIAKKGDTVKVRFEVGGLFYAGSSSWIFAYDADVFEQVTGVTARANSNNAYINGIKAQIFEVNGAAAFNAYDDDMDKVGGKVVDPRDGSQINNPGYIQVTLDPDVNSMTNGYKTVSFDDVETYMIELILKIRTDTTKTSGSIWMPTELARSADNIMGDTYIAYSANEAALTNVETDVVKFDAEPVSTVKLVPEERPDTAITLALPTEGGVKLGEFVDTSADPEKRSTANKTFYGPEGTEILSTFTTDDTNYYETYTGNGTPWNVVGFPEPVRTGYHITAWNKTSGSGTAETWDSYNFASADQNGNTYTASWEADSHTIYFYNDPECTNLRGEVAVVYDQTGITPVVYQSGAITEFIGWIHQGDPCDAEHVLPSTYFETYTVTGDDSFYAYTKNARKTVSLVGYNDSTNANIGTVTLTEAVQDALGIELRVGDTLSIVNEIPANPANGYYYITKDTADTLLRGEYTYESGGSTVTVSSSMGSTAKNFYAIKDITTPVNLAIAAAGDNEIRVAYRPLDFTVYFKSAPASGNFAPVVDGAAAHPGYNGGFGETLVTDPDTGILTWSITGPYNTTYDFDIASAGLVAPFGWKFQNYTPGTNRGTFRATGTNTSMTYTAQWSPASVTVHWLSEDFSEVKTATCNYNANYNVYTNAPSMTKDGYQFMGWKHAIVSGNTYTAAGDLITASANSIYNCSTSPEGTTYVVGTGVGTVASESDYIGLGTDATYDIYYLPVFQINQYNIIYNTIYTDGEYNPDPFGIGYDYGSTVTEFATVSDVTGYTFDGWYDESVYADKTNVITSKTIGAENINVYGYFTPNNYTVNFDPNGGTGDVQGVTVAYNAQITAPATAPTRTGYELLGWAETSDATEALATLPELTEAAASIGGVAKTLYAVWGINQYTISYDANGGTLTDEATATFDYNATITNPTAPTRTGYDFAGWAYSNADTHEAYTGSTMPAFNLDAQAQWNIKSYEVTFDTDGGSANTTSTFEYGATIVPPADPTKTGYTFAGWSGIPADGKMPAEDITVIATWTANVYTINYSTDGTAVAADVLTYGTDSVPAKTGKVTTKDGYDFDDWYLDSALATAYTSDWATVIANAQPKAGGNDNEYEMTVYAGWDINEYTLTFDSQGGTQIPAITQDYNTDITAPADPTKEGYTFTGWTPAIPAKMPARDTTVVAGWQLEGYTIHFDSKGGSAVADISRAYGLAISAPANPTKTGYDFIGWYTDTDCTAGNEFTFPETMPDLGANGAEIILYAKWSTNQYTITFDSKGGSAVAPITQDYNTAVTAPAAPTKTGYDFAGWYTDAEYTGNEYTFSTMPAQSFILYAKWQVKQYTITFDSKGGSAVAPITQDYNTAVTAPAAPTKTGYDFIGWYTDENCTDGNEYTFSTMPAESFILYAKWQIKQYTITFDSKGGSAVAPITLDYNTAVTAPADPTRTGYTFDKSNGTSGWYTDPNCTAGTEYVFSTMPAQNINLYAKWTVAQYTITILDGIDNSIVIDTITQDYDTNVSPTEPTRTGYTFGGYYEEAALLNQYTFSKMPAENISVYVKWNAIEIRVDFLEPDASYNPADSAHNTLTFNDKAVFNNISSYYVDFNDTLSEVPSGNPDPDYYTFIGWSETEGGAVIENISAWVINEANFNLVQTVGGEKVVYLYPVFEREDVTLEVEVVEDGPVIVTASGEGINGYIYNAGSKLTKTALASELRVIGNGTLIITASKGKYCGTGTKIELKDNVTEQIVEVYYVIVCGDLNGDANCNAVDHGIAERRVNEGETNNKVSAEINHCYDLAGDVNGDGLFNSDDTAAIEAYLFHDVSYDFNTNIGKYVVVPKNA